MRQLFRNNDPEAKGQVNRDVLLMVLTKLLGRFISSKQYQQLLLRLQLSEKTIVKFEELYAAVRDPVAEGAPAWLNTVNRYNGRALMTAAQVHAQLKEKTKQRFLDLAELLPQKNPGGASRIVAPEFQNILNRMGFHMEEEEFEKLWKRKALDSKLLMTSKSRFDCQKELSRSSTSLLQAGKRRGYFSSRQSRTLSKAEEERKASITIEKWLKDKFREGFKNMKIEFEKYDPGKTCKVQQEEFLCALEKFDLHLKKEHVKLFLARCGLENNKSEIDYVEFLKNFQDRSERGVTHKILSNPQHKYDKDGLGAIKGDAFLKRLGIDFRNSSANHAENAVRKSRESMNSEDSPRQSRTLSKAEEERKASITIEKWLKDKFREGFKNMKIEFEKYDPGKTCKVQQEEFLCALEKFDLHLKKEHVKLFLARCGLENNKSEIDYVEFLKNFQDRSERGVTHKILSNPQHNHPRATASEDNAALGQLTGNPAGARPEYRGHWCEVQQEEFLCALEKFDLHLKKEHVKLFLARCGLENNKSEIDYVEFLKNFQDRSERGVTHKILSNPQHKFSLEITDEEFEEMLDRIPLDDDGNIRYPQFMAMFDSRKGAPSLFDVKSEITSTKSSMEEMKQNPSLKQERSQYKHGRTPDQLFGIIKTLVNKNYQAVEKTFEELDENNTRRLTQEAMYQLLKGFDIHPEISRGEIRRLWETLITNQDKTLDFLEFVRHFGYSPKSACFPNAKISPPKKGDDNFRLRSKKLNCASDILVDSVRAKVEYLLDDLQKEFDALDPYHTGFVTKEEFKDILTELCVQLNAYECDMLEKKFERKGDGRVSYLEFLKPYALQRQRWRNGTNMAAVLQHSHRDVSEPPAGNHTSGLDTLTTRLRNKLQGEWKNLRRAFKKLDSDGSGFLSITEFRSVLKLCNLILDEDEVYHIMSKFDHNMDGHIEYNKFLEEACKKETAIGENIE
ncbi:UNVERIFIED_CONTAM: hypothetical protein FKN15_059367 [Acipenser sinensis]